MTPTFDDKLRARLRRVIHEISETPVQAGVFHRHVSDDERFGVLQLPKPVVVYVVYPVVVFVPDDGQRRLVELAFAGYDAREGHLGTSPHALLGGRLTGGHGRCNRRQRGLGLTGNITVAGPRGV